MALIHDLSSLKTVPESYTWTKSDDKHRMSASSLQDGESIPVIDLTDANVATLIGNACREWGAFQIANHGIPMRLLDDVVSLCQSLFGLSSELKLACSKKGSQSGYGASRIAPSFDKKMWSEGFTIAGSYHDHFRTLWPDEHTKYREIMEEYEDEMKKLAGKLIGFILASLDVSEDELEWTRPKGDGFGAVRLNHYPACPEPDRAMGLPAHTDSTLLTILHQNNAAGLQMFKEETGWVQVKPVPGLLVVNVGDLIHILSNGKIPSVVHQALVNQIRSRYSIAYFWGTSGDIDISPISKLVSPEEPAVFRPVKLKEYFELKDNYCQKALSMIRAPLME